MSAPRVLIVRFSAIGDCILTAWSATAIRKRWPDARIVWAVQDNCAPVIASPQLADRVEIFRRREWRWKLWSPRAVAGQVRFAKRLRSENFDVGFDFQGLAKTALTLYFARPKQRFTVPSQDMVVRGLNPVVELEEGLHEVERGLRLIRQWEPDIEPVTRPIMPDLPRPENAEKHRPLATIQTGAGHPTKLYPPLMWEEVVRLLRKQGVRPVTIGAPGDPLVINSETWVGRFGLLESMAWVRASDVHIAADTGTGHVAAAYGIPSVSVFGPMDQARYRPYGDQATILNRGGKPEEVTPQEIVDAAMERLGR